MRGTERGNGPQRGLSGENPRVSTARRVWLIVEYLLVLALLLAVIVSGVRRCRKTGSLFAERETVDVLTSPVPNPTEREALAVTLIDVGQGDAILVRSPSGRTMLVDAGPEDMFFSIRAALRAYGIERLDAVVATHPHTDHIGSMAGVLDRYEVERFYMTDFPGATPVYERMLRALKKEGCPVYNTDSLTEIDWDEAVSVAVLNPICGQVYEDANASSIVLRIDFGKTAILLTGDMEQETETLLLGALGKEALDADVLKLGHHGSQSATGVGFLDAVSPKYAIVSLGKGNEYGHPHRAVKNLLKARDIPLYRTDQHGLITVFSDGETVTIVP